jgi:hypothetical protein
LGPRIGGSVPVFPGDLVIRLVIVTSMG